MVRLITSTTPIEIADRIPKEVREFVGRRNSGTSDLSIAYMQVPAGSYERGQTPEFTEYLVLLSGSLWVRTSDATIEVHAGQAVIIPAHNWVQYGAGESTGAEYITVCVPAFSPETVHRDGP